MIAMTIYACLVLVAIAFPARATEFTAMTTPLPPYSINKGLHVHGISVDVLAMLMTLSGSPMTTDDVKLMLWSHAFQLTERGPKRIMLNLPRTPKLEPLFKWVGPIHTANYVVIGRQTAKPVNSLSDLHKRKTATIRDTLPEKTLLEAGVPKSSLKPSLTHVIPLKKLKAKMVDYFVHSDASATYMLDKMSMKHSDYKILHTFLQVPLYYGFSKDTSDAFIERLNQNLVKIKAPGKDGMSRFDHIVKKYLPKGMVQ